MWQDNMITVSRMLHGGLREPIVMCIFTATLNQLCPDEEPDVEDPDHNYGGDDHTPSLRN